MKGLRLIATGGALPGRTVTNEELSRTVDTSDEWITTRTGIRNPPQLQLSVPNRFLGNRYRDRLWKRPPLR
jgi:hypothetical protein